jgi:hypothetical protein
MPSASAIVGGAGIFVVFEGAVFVLHSVHLLGWRWWLQRNLTGVGKVG